MNEEEEKKGETEAGEEGEGDEKEKEKEKKEGEKKTDDEEAKKKGGKSGGEELATDGVTDNSTVDMRQVAMIVTTLYPAATSDYIARLYREAYNVSVLQVVRYV